MDLDPAIVIDPRHQQDELPLPVERHTRPHPLHSCGTWHNCGDCRLSVRYYRYYALGRL